MAGGLEEGLGGLSSIHANSGSRCFGRWRSEHAVGSWLVGRLALTQGWTTPKFLPPLGLNKRRLNTEQVYQMT